MEYKILATWWRQGTASTREVVRICYHLPYITSCILPAIRHPARGTERRRRWIFRLFWKKLWKTERRLPWGRFWAILGEELSMENREVQDMIGIEGF